MAKSNDRHNFDDWLTTAEASRLLQLTQRRIRQLIEAGELVGQKIATVWVVSRESVEDLLNKK